MKTTLLVLFSFMIFGQAYTQAEAEILADQMLQSEKIDSKSLSAMQKINKAILLLDDQKEAKELSEDQFQQKMNVLINGREKLNQQMIDNRVKNAQAHKAERQNQNKKSIYQKQMAVLKRKLDAGQMSQVEYDARIENLKEREKKQFNKK